MQGFDERRKMPNNIHVWFLSIMILVSIIKSTNEYLMSNQHKKMVTIFAPANYRHIQLQK